MRLPDPARSHAVLIGTSSYQTDELADLPAVRNNLDALAAALTHPSWGGFTRQGCTILLDHTDAGTIYRMLRQHACNTEDTLLVYFAGHGLIGPRRHELYLSLTDTHLNELLTSALPFDWVREIFLDSPATNRVLILDCCYSGRAVAELMASPTESIISQTEITGTYTLASTTADNLALAPVAATYTAFTGELIDLLRHGIPDGPELLTLNTIYRRLRHTTTIKGIPRPSQRGTDTSDSLALTRNPGYRRPRSATLLLIGALILIVAVVAGVLFLAGPSGIVLTGHTSWVTGVAFSPDGHILATASKDKTARLWDLTSRQPIGDPLTGHTDDVLDVAFSPDGRMLATASRDKTARLWDVTSRQPVGNPLIGHTEDVEDVAFSPDGSILATVSDDRTVRLWGVTSHMPIGDPLIGHTERVIAVAFSPDGRTLATSGIDNMVRLWDVTSHRPIGGALAGHRSYVTDVAFSPDRRILASSSFDKTVLLWDLATHQLIGDPLSHLDGIESVAFSPDGRTLASAGRDKTVRLWDVASHQLIGDPLTGHTEGIESVAFSPDGRTLASASRDATIRLWDRRKDRPNGYVAMSSAERRVRYTLFDILDEHTAVLANKGRRAPAISGFRSRS